MSRCCNRRTDNVVDDDDGIVAPATPILASDGSASDPAYSYVSNNDTGWYLQLPNTQICVIDGVPYLQIASTAITAFARFIVEGTSSFKADDAEAFTIETIAGSKLIIADTSTSNVYVDGDLTVRDAIDALKFSVQPNNDLVLFRNVNIFYQDAGGTNLLDIDNLGNLTISATGSIVNNGGTTLNAPVVINDTLSVIGHILGPIITEDQFDVYDLGGSVTRFSVRPSTNLVVTRNMALNLQTAGGLNYFSVDTSGNTIVDGTLTQNGNAVFNGVFQTTSFSQILSTYYITSESDLTAFDLGGIYELPSGTYVMDDGSGGAVTFTQAIGVVSGAQVLIRGQITWAPTAVNDPLFQIIENATPSIPTLLRLESFTAFNALTFPITPPGINLPNGRGFNISSTTPGFVGLLMTNARFIGFYDLGDVDGLYGFIATNFSLDSVINEGLTITNTVQTLTFGPLLTVYNTAVYGANATSIDYFQIESNNTANIQANLLTFQPPNSSTYLYNISSAYTSFGTFSNGVDITGQLFNPVGLGQTSPNLKITGFKGIPDSGVMVRNIKTTLYTTPAPQVDQWMFIDMSSASITEVERATIDNFGRITVTDQDTSTVRYTNSLTLSRTTASNPVAEVSFGTFVDEDAAASTDLTTDRVTSTVTGIADGDIVRFTSAGTAPTDFNLSLAYYIFNISGSTFQLSAVSPFVAVNITTSQTGIGIEVYTPRVFSTSTELTAGPRSVFFTDTLTISENSSLIPLLRNTSTAIAIDIDQSGILIN